MVLVTMLWATAMAQSSDCTSVLITMAPCLNYVTGSSPTPSASCCSQLANVVQSQPGCLCMALNGGGASLGDRKLLGGEMMGFTPHPGRIYTLFRMLSPFVSLREK